MKDKKYLQVGDHCLYIVEHKGTAHNICNLKHSVPQEIPIAFYNGSNCDYHFMIKVLYRRKYRKIHKFCSSNRKWRKKYKNISFILQFIVSNTFMASSLSNLVNNLSEGM